ncbi:MAG TPA: hypothetical protein VGI10_11465 [Polyangiaceae bacterium]|jgi:hypothetical protein
MLGIGSKQQAGLVLARLCLLAALTGCGASPSAPRELGAGSVLERVSNGGLVTARLSATAPVVVGTNNLQLELTPSTSGQSVQVDAFSALMPAYGHSASPTRIEPQGETFAIDGLMLSMSGAWELTANLHAAGAPDEVVFDIDVP